MNPISYWGAERILLTDPVPPSTTTPYDDLKRYGDIAVRPEIAGQEGTIVFYWTRTVTSTSPLYGAADANLAYELMDPLTGALGASVGQQGNDGVSLQYGSVLEIESINMEGYPYAIAAWIGFGASIDIQQGQYSLQFSILEGSGNEVELGVTAHAISDLSLVRLEDGFAVVYTRSPSGYVGGNFTDGADPSSAGVYAQIFGAPIDADLFEVLAPEFRVNDPTAGNQTGSDATALGANLLVVWNDAGASIKAKVLTSAGVAVVADTTLVNGAIAGAPVVTALAGGNVALAWTQSGDVWARVFDTSLVPLGNAVRINDNTLNNQELPEIAASADGGFVVLFNDSSFTPPDTGDAALMAQKFDANGAKIGANLLVPSTLSGNHINHDITRLGDGRMLATWSDSDGATTRMRFLDDRGPLLYGTPQDDTIYGADSDSAYANGVLVAGDGNDLAYGLGGNDYVYGGAGIDTARGGFGVDVLLGEDGNDQLFGEGDNDYLYGGVGNDAMSGGDGVDVLIGEAGNDTGYGGNDADYFYLGDGDDSGFGETGNDIFVMEAGNDSAVGGDGQDYFYMGAGNDTLDGGPGVDVMLGEAGNDVFFGGTGVDYLYLGPGGAGDHDTVLVDRDLSGVQVVYDFEAGGTNDVIRLTNSGMTSFTQVLAATTDYSVNGFIVITLDADTNIWLIGVTPAQLTAGDFLFG